MIGKLRHRITIEAPQGAQDAFGEEIRSWTPVTTVWARVEPLRGRERWTAQQVQAEVTHKILVRGNGILPTHRIKFGSRIFAVEFARNIEERGIWTEVLAREVV